jgi:hypothetical protein
VLDPVELGSSWSADVSSLFAFGALVVVLPFMFGGGTAALVTAAIVYGIGHVIGQGAV